MKPTIREIFTAILTVGTLLFVGTCTYQAATSEPEPPTRKQVIENAFGSEGQYLQLVRIIKHDLNDPESFRHIETRYYEHGQNDTLQVYMNYRSKNVFGGYEVHEAVALTSIATGKVYEIILND